MGPDPPWEGAILRGWAAQCIVGTTVHVSMCVGDMRLCVKLLDHLLVRLYLVYLVGVRLLRIEAFVGYHSRHGQVVGVADPGAGSKCC